MKRYLAFALFAALLVVTACTPAQQASTASAVTTSLSTAQADLDKAKLVYGIAKGMAPIAEAAGLPASTVTAITTKADAAFATAQAALTAGTTDATAIAALVKTFSDQATALTVTAAPFIKAVPAKAPNTAAISTST
jgi:hypothetical protein